jgi:prevent-host-death family protein
VEINIHQAKTMLSQLIERALSGEEVIIAKAGKPVVRLVRIEPVAKRVLGSAAGTIRYAPGWDEPLSDRELEEFVGR